MALPMENTRRWRRWAALAAYVGLLLAALLVLGSEPVALALYRVTLPWSAFSFGSTSATFGWFVLGAGAIVNAGLAFAIGRLLDERVTVAGAPPD